MARRTARRHRRPHLGPGYGGKWELTGEIEKDRAGALKELIEQVESGDFDDILKTSPVPGGPNAE